MQQQRLTLLKTTDHPEVGHLYEHAYIAGVRRYFASCGLHAYLDYDIQGWTFGKGVVYVTISLLTPGAMAQKDAVVSIKVDTVDEMAIYIKQIELENGYSMEITDNAELNNEIIRLDKLPWSDLDSLDVINLQDVTHGSDILRESQEKCKRDRFVVEVTVSKTAWLLSHPETLVLFRQLSWLLMHAYIASLCSQSRIYSAQDSFIDTNELASLKNVFYCDDTSFDFRQSAVAIKELTDNVVQDNVLDAFIWQLHKNSYNRADISCIDDVRMYQETGIFIGQAGWRRLATRENVSRLLEIMHVEVRLKKKKSVFRVR